MTEHSPRISVVIPSTMRDTLRRAVDSALGQSYPPVEVIVVFDLDRLPEKAEDDFQDVRVMITGGGRGPNAARQLGIESAAGDAIALLDDDDYWYPDKLRVQADLLRGAWREGMRPIVSVGLKVVDPQGKELDVLPRRILRDGQSISDYLFKRREIRQGEAVMPPSALLIDRDLLVSVPLDQGKDGRHEDWDWVLRAANREHVRFLMAPGAHLAYCRQTRGMSRTRRGNWAGSVEWAEQHRQFLSRREYGDFLLGVSVPLALDSGARWGGSRIVLRAFHRGRPGPAATIWVATLLMLPRSAPDVYVRWRADWRRVRKSLLGVCSKRRIMTSGS